VEQAATRVEGQLLVRREIVPGAALACGKPDAGLDATAEALARRAQRQLRVDLQLARDVDGGEQHVAELVEALVAAGLVVGVRTDHRLQLVELVAHRLQRAFHAREVEAGGGGAALQLARVQQRGEVLRHLGEDALLAPLLALLDLVPVAQDLSGVLDLDVPEDVRMPADQLLPAVLGDRGEIAGPSLLQQQREEVHLEQHVAELVEQLAVVATVRGVGELVGLLERVRDDRPLVLLTVPRAFASQATREVVETRERLLDLRPARAHAREPTCRWCWRPRPAAAKRPWTSSESTARSCRAGRRSRCGSSSCLSSCSGSL
jgi:hypothetical protein